MAHNLYTQLQVDQGRALDALKRLLDRARRRRSDAAAAFVASGGDTLLGLRPDAY